MQNKDKEREVRTKTHEEKRNELDEHSEQKFVDDIPDEEVKIEVEDEKNKKRSKDDSLSERKYK